MKSSTRFIVHCIHSSLITCIELELLHKSVQEYYLKKFVYSVHTIYCIITVICKNYTAAAVQKYKSTTSV